MADLDGLGAKRLAKWRQDGSRRIGDPVEAEAFIEEVGMCTHYAASSEFPNLFQGYMSDSQAKTTASWDSPSGHVYTWRWEIGRKQVAFYGAIVAGKPTWVSWEMLPYLLAACMEMRTPDELFDSGLISEAAYKVACAFDDTDGVLSTRDLRNRAGYPSGKDNRTAYLKALAELEGSLLVAKHFGEGKDDDMDHVLVDLHYRDYAEKARAIGPEEGLVGVIERYLPGAAYLDLKVFARHLRLQPDAVGVAADRLTAAGKATRDGNLLVAV